VHAASETLSTFKGWPSPWIHYPVANNFLTFYSVGSFQLFMSVQCVFSANIFLTILPVVLRASNRARCRRCCGCRTFLLSHGIISICRPIGGYITLSTYTYHTSTLFETLSTGYKETHSIVIDRIQSIG